MRIALDLDDTITDLVGAWLNEYNECYGDTVQVEQIIDWDIASFCHKCSRRELFGLLTPDLFTFLSPRDGVVDYIGKLWAQGHTMCIATSRPSSGSVCEAKLHWIEHFIGDIGQDGIVRDVLFVSDKSFIHANVLVDDGLHNLDGFNGHRVLFDRPWNRNVGGVRVDNRAFDWHDVYRICMEYSCE